MYCTLLVEILMTSPLIWVGRSRTQSKYSVRLFKIAFLPDRSVIPFALSSEVAPKLRVF